jgi:hypothetical protein
MSENNHGAKTVILEQKRIIKKKKTKKNTKNLLKEIDGPKEVRSNFWINMSGSIERLQTRYLDYSP